MFLKRGLGILKIDIFECNVQNEIMRTNLFCSVNFFPAKIFSGILEKRNLSGQKKIWREKNSLSKKGYPKL
jgi:hypothetical protein